MKSKDLILLSSDDECRILVRSETKKGSTNRIPFVHINIAEIAFVYVKPIQSEEIEFEYSIHIGVGHIRIFIDCKNKAKYLSIFSKLSISTI